MQALQPKLEAMEAMWFRLHSISGAETPDDVVSHWEGGFPIHVSAFPLNHRSFACIARDSKFACIQDHNCLLLMLYDACNFWDASLQLRADRPAIHSVKLPGKGSMQGYREPCQCNMPFRCYTRYQHPFTLNGAALCCSWPSEQEQPGTQTQNGSNRLLRNALVCGRLQDCAVVAVTACMQWKGAMPKSHHRSASKGGESISGLQVNHALCIQYNLGHLSMSCGPCAMGFD